MKTKTSFGRCLGLLIHKHGITQTQLSQRSDVDQSTISKIVAKNRRVDDDVAKALCSCWPDRADNIQLLIAGLGDVIRRWGFDPDADVAVTPLNAVAPAVPTQSELDIAVLRDHLSDETVADLIHDLAVILRRADAARAYPEAFPDRSGYGSSTAAELKPFA